MCKTNPIPAAAGGRRRKLCETKPNLGGLGYVRKGRYRTEGSAGEGNAQNKANFWRGRNGAKRCVRKGLGEKWQMRVRPKTKPIWPSGLRAGTVPMSPGGAFVVCPSGHDQETPYGVTTSAGTVQNKANSAGDGVWALGAFGF
jgi:hypothetical protein